MTSGRVHKRPHGLLDVLRQGNLGALVLPLCLLAAGWGARARLSRKTVAFRWHGVELRHPAGWTVAEQSADPAEGDSVVLIDLLGPGRIKPRVTLRVAPTSVPPPAGSQDASPPRGPEGKRGAPDETEAEVAAPGSGIAETLANRLPLYYPMAEQTVQIGGFFATRVDSAFAFTPRAVPGRKGDIPVVLRAIDLVVLRGAEALSIQVAAPIEDFEAQRPTLEAIVSSLQVDSAAAATRQAEAPGNGRRRARPYRCRRRRPTLRGHGGRPSGRRRKRLARARRDRRVSGAREQRRRRDRRQFDPDRLHDRFGRFHGPLREQPRPWSTGALRRDGRRRRVSLDRH